MRLRHRHHVRYVDLERRLTLYQGSAYRREEKVTSALRHILSAFHKHNNVLCIFDDELAHVWKRIEAIEAAVDLSRREEG